MVSHRIRGKSAPRGRSPHPKELKKAAKGAAAQRSKSKGKEGKTKKDGFVTPPTKSSARSTSSESKPRRLSFGENSVHAIQAENQPGKKTTYKDLKDMKSSEADAIINGLKKEWGG